MKKHLSLILAMLMIFSVFAVIPVSAEEAAGLSELPQLNSGYNRYYFLAPDDWFWDDSTTIGIYWEEGSNAPESWPGYKAHKADADNVYYYDVPSDVKAVIWNNFYTNGEIDFDFSTYNKRTEWLSAQNTDGSANYSGMIAVCKDKWKADPENGNLYPPCTWYCYYGNGKYGTEHTGEESNTYRYYFYLPEEWDTDDAVASVYWWYPQGLDDIVFAEKTNVEGLYYCDVPTETTYLCFSNSPESALEGKGMSVYVDCKYQRGKIFVIDFDKTTPNNDYTNEFNYQGDWYIYYGDGTFGVSDVKGEVFYSCRSFSGDNPAPVIETNRYYFYMPEDWDNIMSSGIYVYWWEGTNNCGDFWPGYPAHYSNIKGLYYYDVPKDVTSIILTNGVDDNTGIYDVFSSPAKQTENIGTEYYEPGECALYPDGTESFDNMVYVMNYDELLTELEGTTASGNWYYYYGDGEYGITPEKGDVFYNTRQIGEIPNFRKTHPAEGEMTLYFIHNEKMSPVSINYTLDGKEKSKELTFMAENESNILSYANVPENIENVYFSCGDIRTYEIKRYLVHNGCFAFGTVVGDKRDYKAIILDEHLKEIEYILGDADYDGKITIKDATLIQKYLANMRVLVGNAKLAADFNEDGKITIKDATAIQKFLAKS